MTKPEVNSVNTTNYDKFQTKNPIVRKLIDKFYGTITDLAAIQPGETILDAGCGEGETFERLRVEGSCATGLDINPDSLNFAQKRHKEALFCSGSLYHLPFEDNQFDKVFCLEVLEHLQYPERAIAELNRVTKKDIFLSVPHEPWFILGSLARGKYLSNFGNHPEHINHWRVGTFRNFLQTRIRVRSIQSSLPWIIAHCEKRS